MILKKKKLIQKSLAFWGVSLTELLQIQNSLPAHKSKTKGGNIGAEEAHRYAWSG